MTYYVLFELESIFDIDYNIVLIWLFGYGMNKVY